MRFLRPVLVTRQTLLPVAIGAHDSPERAAAPDLLTRIDIGGPGPMQRQDAPPGP